MEICLQLYSCSFPRASACTIPSTRRVGPSIGQTRWHLDSTSPLYCVQVECMEHNEATRSGDATLSWAAAMLQAKGPRENSTLST